MKRGEVLRAERIKHVDELRKLGVDPYPASVERRDTIQAAREQLGNQVAVAGRVMSLRLHGKALFLDLADESGKIQIYAKADELGERYAELELLDEGDFLAVQGPVFTTKMGEITIHTENFQLLVKTLRPLPSAWHGLKDTEERYRKRYLDLILNPEVKQLFQVRARTLKEIRAFMDNAQFTEVETPTLQPMYGGASARPFLTHYHAYDTHVFLKIAPELYLKRLLVGGYERVYEISRNFRNEGADATHNPEFLALEFYAAYWDEHQLMDFTENLITTVVTNVRGRPEIEIGGKTITINQPFRRITFADLTKGAMTDEAFKAGVKELQEPTFVLNTPRYLVPLAKGLNDEVARSFQFVMGGIELIKAFAEQNDPAEQRHQFDIQMAGRDHGDDEAQPLDEDFLEALEYGMPPTAGWGMGLERFIALLAGQDTLRQTMYFPFMKPKVKTDVSAWLAKESKKPTDKGKK